MPSIYVNTRREVKLIPTKTFLVKDTVATNGVALSISKTWPTKRAYTPTFSYPIRVIKNTTIIFGQSTGTSYMSIVFSADVVTAASTTHRRVLPSPLNTHLTPSSCQKNRLVLFSKTKLILDP